MKIGQMLLMSNLQETKKTCDFFYTNFHHLDLAFASHKTLPAYKNNNTTKNQQQQQKSTKQFENVQLRNDWFSLKVFCIHSICVDSLQHGRFQFIKWDMLFLVR